MAGAALKLIGFGVFFAIRRAAPATEKWQTRGGCRNKQPTGWNVRWPLEKRCPAWREEEGTDPEPRCT